MLWVIDPDVFEASLTNPECQATLEQIRLRLTTKQQKFVIDQSHEEIIWEEYFNFWKKYRRGNSNHPAIQILTHLFASKKNTCRTSSDRKPWNRVIGRYHCKHPVEPQLIAMAASIAVDSPILLLCGDPAKLRDRVLHNTSVCRSIRADGWVWFDVEYASNKGAGSPRRAKSGMADLLSDKFESKVALALNDIESVRYVLPPDEDKYGEEIDVWGQKQSSGGKFVFVVGECKLEEEGSLKKVGKDTIRQVNRKAKAVEQHWRMKGYDNFQVHRYIISNAPDLTDAAKDEAKTIATSGRSIKYWRATINNNWEKTKKFTKLNLSLIDDFT